MATLDRPYDNNLKRDSIVTKKYNYKEGDNGDFVLYGYYIPDPKNVDSSRTKYKRYKFNVLKTEYSDSATNTYYEFFVESDNASSSIFEMTKRNFVEFMNDVLDKSKIFRQGTWTSYDRERSVKAKILLEADADDTHPMVWEEFIRKGGSSRKSKRIHRKPTKRRRSRRGNRKTKKN